MVTNVLDVRIVDSVEDAPKYGRVEFEMIKATTAIIVPRGTEQGNPTVDMQFEDQHGNKFIAMFTGNIVESLAGAIKGVRIRTGTH